MPQMLCNKLDQLDQWHILMNLMLKIKWIHHGIFDSAYLAVLQLIVERSLVLPHVQRFEGVDLAGENCAKAAAAGVSTLLDRLGVVLDQGLQASAEPTTNLIKIKMPCIKGVRESQIYVSVPGTLIISVSIFLD